MSIHHTTSLVPHAHCICVPVISSWPLTAEKSAVGAHLVRGAERPRSGRNDAGQEGSTP